MSDNVPLIKKKVAVICTAPLRARGAAGGAYAAVLGEALANAGVDVELWSKVTTEELAPCAVPVMQIWRPGALAWFDIIRAVVRRKPDIVHFQHFVFLLGNGAAAEASTFLLMLTFALLQIRVVATLHDVPGPDEITPAYIREHNYHYPAWLIKIALGMIFKTIAMASRKIVVHDGVFAKRAIRFGVPSDKIEVIAHLRFPAKMMDRVSARRALDLPEDVPTVLFFGYATGYKGIDVLLDAFALLESRGKPIELVLGTGLRPKAFDGPSYLAFYEEICARARRLSNVRMVGFIPEDLLGTYLCATDIGVLPYREYHGASGPMHHFLSYGRPMLVSDAIASHMPGIEAGSFENRPDAIADSLVAYFEGTAGDAVRQECERLRGAPADHAYVGQTADLYTEALR